MHRINNSGCQQSAPIFNSLFQDFPHELMKVCAGLDKPDTATYVSNPAEDLILAFTQSMIGDVGALVGSKGIGKTSVINHLVYDVWPREGCACLLLDLAEEGPSPTQFGDKYYDLPDNQRLHLCKLAAIRLTNKAILRYFDSIFPTPADVPVAACASLLRKLNPSLVSIAARIEGESDVDTLKYAREQDLDAFHLFLLYFAVHHTRKLHVKLVIDELDDQDSLFILVLAERLARLRASFESYSTAERKSDSAVPARHLTTLIACRGTTFSYVTAMQEQLDGMDWFNFHRINIQSASQLGKILAQRYDAHVANREMRPGDLQALRLKFGVQERDAVIKDRDVFFRRLFAALAETKQASLIVNLCNNDLSDALAATLEVFRNRYEFLIRTDSLFQIMAVPKSERAEQASKVLTPTTVLRCLAYGNQAQDFPMYPICHTRVPNPLRSSVLSNNNRKTSLMKIRMLSWFVHRQAHSPTAEFAPRIDVIEETMSRFFGLQRPLIRQVVDEMHAERLLEHSHGLKKPSSYGDGCVLSITPRASCLWQELAENSIIHQCHREVADLDPNVRFQEQGHEWCQTRTYVTDIKKWFADLPWLCAQLWMHEKDHFDELDDSLVQDFVSEFGTVFVTAHISNGITGSIHSFFKYEIKDKALVKKVLDMCADLRSESQDKLEARLQSLESDE